MNEFVAVPKNQLYLYYLILAIVYIIFLRNLRPTYLTATIFLLFNKGFPESLIPDYGTAITKIFFVMLLLILLVRAKNRITDKKKC